MLVSQFVLGLRDELKPVVEVQLPMNVAEAALYATVQEGVLERSAQLQPSRAQRQEFTRNLGGAKFDKGEMWKAKQPKDFRRANGLCYKCGDKYNPGHLCAAPVMPQVKAIQVAPEILSDEVLDAIAHDEDLEDEQDMHVSLNAVSGADHPDTIQLRALVGNKVMLLLVDSGSSHSFIDSQLVHELHCPITPLPPTKVRVANGAMLNCHGKASNLSWWVRNTTFEYDFRVLDLGGYDAILGMDWLAQWGAMTCHWNQR